MQKIAIFGAGGFGREVFWLIHEINSKGKKFEFIGFFDDGVEKGSFVHGYPVLGGLNDLVNHNKFINIVYAIGNPIIKEKIINNVGNRDNIIYPNLIHPNCLIGDTVKMGKGNIICASNILTVDIELGNHVILNLACTVGHDTVIKDYCSFMPGINISGEVVINKSVYVGTGAKIINQLEIGVNSIIGAGAVVSKSIPPNCTAVGIPAKPIKFHDEK